MATYQPNLNDPRVRRRCEQALNWIRCYVSSGEHWQSTREIDRHFGNMSRPLGRWLRSQLLINEDPHYNYQTGKCKTFVKNKQGIKELEELLGNPEPKIATSLTQQLETGDFEYEEKSNREWNPLQNLPTEVRKPMFARHGMTYHYDVRCAAPTLIKQYALELGMTKKTPALDAYINDRKSVRQRISTESGIDEKTVKQIINALLQGALMAVSHHSSIFEYVGKDKVKLKWLQQDTYLIQLREDFKSCWTAIKPSLNTGTITDRLGRTRSRSISPRLKSKTYRELEQRVMKSVWKYLKKDKNKFFKEHDGWCCEHQVQVEVLKRYIKTQTGIEIDFECERWVGVNDYV